MDVELLDVFQLKCCAAKLIVEMISASSDLMDLAGEGGKGVFLSETLPDVAQR